MAAPSSHLYAVLDPARAKDLRPLLELAGPAVACLYDGPLDPALKAACPHLVHLGREPTLRDLWFSKGWGNAWGVMLASPLETPQIRRRLRHLTLARLPDGEGPMLFRFWDPRVLRVYLSTCLEPELAPWFEGIDWWGAETFDGGQQLRYALDEGRLSATIFARPS